MCGCYKIGVLLLNKLQVLPLMY